MSVPVFRVRHSAHPKYRFVVRGKVDGKWRRRYFSTKSEADAFAHEQNYPASASGGNGTRHNFVPALDLAHPEKSPVTSANGLVDVVSAEYLGPKIKRYYGDHWSMHLPFAYDLMREFRPRIFVELGVWKGESYFTFCQSAAENNVAVKCYGVDSWRGDVHMGELDSSIRTEVQDYNLRYAAFSELKAKTFDEAVNDFPDRSIHLLHIDGAHSYEDVRRDFESFLPKLSTTGVVLFHDVSVRGSGFGVWRLWQEIARRKSSFVFEFGYGLGVWRQTNSTGADCRFLESLFQATIKEREVINRRYATAAAALALWKTEQGTKSLLRRANEELETARQRILKLEQVFAPNTISELRKTAENEPGRNDQPALYLRDHDEQDRTAANAAAKLEKDLEASRAQTKHLLTSLKIARARFEGAQAYNERLKQQRNALKGARPPLAAALFDPSWYLGEYPDVAAAGMDPLTHYLLCGVHERRNPNPLFDTAWYCACNPDVAANGINPLEHYLMHGAREGRDPCPLFSTSWYLTQNPDLAATGVNPLHHYLEHGIREGRAPHPLFDPEYYRAQVPEAHDANPVEHYLKSGGWNASPHPLFDVKWYREQNPEILGGLLPPLSHYLEIGARKGRDPHPLFDTAWYLDRNPDVRADGLNPLVHYVAAGSAEGRDPHPLFDTSWYQTQNADACPPGVDPLTHYVTRGHRENRNPHPLFDTSWYLQKNGDVVPAGANPLVHFWHIGGAEGRDPHPLFDSSWYLETNPDVRQNSMNPLWHYLSVGADEMRDPHPLFQTRHYEKQRGIHQFSSLKSATALGQSRNRQSQDASKDGKKVVYAFTSICLNYVPKAIVLARTLKQHNPDIHFCVLVSDRIAEGALDTIDLFDEVVSIDDLDIANKPSWIFRHSIVELCTAVKGYFLADLLEREDCAAVFYFDPDIVCFSSLELLTEKLKQASILLTPHLTNPEITTEAIVDNEICALKNGVYNLGFLGLRPSLEGCRFARWWRDRLRDFCRGDVPGGLFMDQRWVDLAPGLFKEVAIIRHPGCNVATWNLTSRNITGDFETGFTVNGRPLIFYHFSGFDSGAQGAMLEKYGSEMPAAHLLRKWYIRETTRSRESHFAKLPWTLGSFSNGMPITEAHRNLYRERVDLRETFPNPFDTITRGQSYYHWFQAEILGRPIGHDGTGYNPLIEFVEAPIPLQPNPFFDCVWYLHRNPDVAAAGLNPLIHFIKYGADEGRQANPGFYPDRYRGTAPA